MSYRTIELGRRTFTATGTGRNRYWMEAEHATEVVLSGPVIVEIVISERQPEGGRFFMPIYTVRADGRHLFGGFAHHLDIDGMPDGISASFVNIEPLKGGPR